MKIIEKTIILANDPHLCIEELHLTLESFWCSAPVDCEQQLRFSSALGEIVGNILRYALDPGDSAIMLRLRLTPRLLEARLTDWGRAWATPLAPPYVMPHHLAEHGRGLAIAAQALDQLRYRRVGNLINCWRLRVYV
ncbi:MAG: ATP-binding protein [Candidatus Viridilinea halotolerans]|uniref:ATP-binding protein n=1 Tax=Candidatus Viridilinea halotolerans TaxID=2491704 RepID=A0A426TWB3_9CHLR|nr:MAG: ATP-binding protein [Candidatus Viridilinea halotolerans]